MGWVREGDRSREGESREGESREGESRERKRRLINQPFGRGVSHIM
jgi:hypothetical protein